MGPFMKIFVPTPLHANHRTMVKYADASDSSYVRVYRDTIAMLERTLPRSASTPSIPPRPPSPSLSVDSTRTSASLTYTADGPSDHVTFERRGLKEWFRRQWRRNYRRILT